MIKKISLICLCVFTSVSMLLFSESLSSAENLAKDSKTDYTFVKFIADQKVLLGDDNNQSPPQTKIDLSDVYDKHDLMQGVEPVLEIIDKGKSAVADPILSEDKVLSINWRGLGKSEIMIKATNPNTNQALIEKLQVEAWSPDYLAIFLTVLGGLGVFLFGMRNMSEGLQLIAGARLRQMITILTDNKFLAIGVGLATTMLIQSSSVTTVMVVGFINSQIMALSQGIGVIMGANIGTTITGWILTLSIDKYGLPIVGVSAFFYLFVKQERTRFIAMIAMGLGFIFFGLQLMQQGFYVLKDVPSFAATMKVFSANSYLGVLKCAGVGCLITLIIQSSSATLGITISLAAMGLIDFSTAAALVLGENVGTTITALLASIGSTTNAKRAAYFHVAFNLIGVFWVTSVFIPCDVPRVVLFLLGMDPATSDYNIKMAIALTHTLFNVTNTVLFCPFVDIAARLLMKYVPDAPPDQEVKSRLTGLNIRLLETASISIERSRIEVLRMANGCNEIAAKVQIASEAQVPDRKMVNEIFKQEEVLDSLQDEIIEFTAGLLSGNISHDVADDAQTQLKIADEIESIGDYFIVIMKSNLKLRDSNLMIQSPEREELSELHDEVESYIDIIFNHYAQRRTDLSLMTRTRPQGRSIVKKVKSIRNKFMTHMSNDKMDPQMIIAISTQLNAYRRIREHAFNIAQAILGIR